MSDQENLLSSCEKDQHNDESPTISYKFSTNYYGPRSQMRKNVLLLIIFSFIAACLFVYVYLNYVAINGSSVSGGGASYRNGDNSPSSNTDPPSNPHKPLSRRKPMLDHESIFSESGPSLLKLSDLMAHCIVALQVGGERVVKMSLKNNNELKDIASKGKTKEGVDDVVTGADMQSHEAILNTIKDTYRRLKIVSEEDTTSAFENLKMEDDILPIGRGRFAQLISENLQQIESENYNWPLVAQHETLIWIDPLDATKEYSENLTEYVTLMACIVHRSTPIVGIIHKPFLNKTYWSINDETRHNVAHSSDLSEIWSNNEAKTNRDDDSLRIAVSRSHAGDIERFIKNKYGNRATTIPAGGSGYKAIELIKGNVNAYLHVTHIKKWDICAPNAILNSLPHGKMTDLRGNQIKFGDAKDKVVTNGLIATTNESRHRELIGAFGSYSYR